MSINTLERDIFNQAIPFVCPECDREYFGEARLEAGMRCGKCTYDKQYDEDKPARYERDERPQLSGDEFDYIEMMEDFER